MSRGEIPDWLKKRGVRYNVDLKDVDKIWPTLIAFWSKALAVGVFSELIRFGTRIGETDIAIIACRLYRDALAPSTKTNYKTVVRHLQRLKQK